MLIPPSEISTSFPKVWQYLNTNSKALRERESEKADNDQWYGYIYRKNLTLFETPKLIVQVISLRGRYAYDEDNIYFTGGGYGTCGWVCMFNWERPASLPSLSGVFTSKLLVRLFMTISYPL